MDKQLQAYLDGELERDALPIDLRADADRWAELDAVAAELRAETAPPWLESRIMASLPAAAAPWWKRGVLWLFQPQTVALRPATAALALLAAGLGWLLLLNRPQVNQLAVDPNATTYTVSAGSPVIYVQFAFADPTAETVTVAGDFNGWDPEATALRDTDGDGIWTGLIALRPGMHKYMFVVNGEKWVTDPEAERYVDDGFGMRNAVIAVALPGRSI